MKIEDREVQSFMVRFGECPIFEAMMWLEDMGCYHAIEGNNCELMRDLCIAEMDYSSTLPSAVSHTVWQWSKSAALEELEKKLLENENADI
jgi:hypothetical protein